RRRRDLLPHARRTQRHHRAPHAPPGAGTADHRQRAGHRTRTARSHLLSAGVRPGRRQRTRAHAGANLRAAPPGHPRMRKRAGPHGLSHRPAHRIEGYAMKPVWVIDDDRSIRWVFEKALTREGIAYRTFDNAQDALSALQYGETPQV